MATKSPKIGIPVVQSGIIATGENPDDYVGSRWIQPAPVEAAAPESSGLIRRLAGDGIVTAVKGAIGVPEAAIGLADLATGGYAGKLAEDAGFRPKEAKEYLDTLYSPEQRAAFAAVQNAANPQDGLGQRIIDTGAAAIRNPSTIVHAVGESLPSMGAGGVIGRGVMAVAPRVAGFAAAGIGEGVVSAGSTAEQIRQGTKDGLMTGGQSALAAGSGMLTAGIGAVAGKVAKGLGIGDIDTLIVGGSHVDPGLQKSFTRKLLEGAFSEGVLEELPQSVQEQVVQNYALGKPLDEGVDQAVVMGVLSGGAMGSGAQVIQRKKVPEVGPLSRGANMAPAVPPAAPAQPVATAPVQPMAPEQAQALQDHANQRMQELSAKAKGTPEAPASMLTPAEKQEQDFLQQAGGDAQAIARAYPGIVEAVTPQAAVPAPEPEQDPIAQTQQAIDASVAQAAQDKARQRATPPASAAELPQPTPEAFDQREQDRPATPIGQEQEGDILNPLGNPFKNMASAITAQRKAGEGFEIVRVAKGLVVRQKESDVQNTTPAAAAQSTAAPVQEAPEVGGVPAEAQDVPGAGSAAVEADGVEKSGNVATLDLEAEKAKHNAAQVRDFETIPITTNRHGVVQSEIRVAKLPNGQWASSHSWLDGDEGGSSPVRNDGPQYGSRDEAVNAAIDSALTRVKSPSAISAWEHARPATAQTKEHAAQWTRMPNADRLALTTRIGMSKLIADKIARAPWDEITAKTQARISEAMSSQTANEPMVSQPASAPKKKAGGGARTAAYEKNPLLTFLATHGLYHEKDKPGSLKSEFSPDKAIMVPGYGVVFKQNGKRLDELVQNAIEDGYLPKDGTEQQLYAMIQRAVAGEKITPQYADGVAERESQARMDARQALEQEQASNDNAEPATADEIEAGQDDVADLSDAAFFILDEDIPLTGPSNMSTESAMRVLGFSEKDIQDAIAKESEGTGKTGQGSEKPDEAVTGAAQGDTGDGSPQAGNSVTPRPGNSEPEGLTSPTRESVLAQQERADKAAKADKAQRAAQELRDKQDRERKDIARASEAAADTFTLGGDPMENLTGQQDVFSQPEKPAPSANTIFTEDAAEKARARLKAKLRNVNSGLDPEMMLDGITLAGYHIEKGARTFAAYAKAMLADLGDGAKPYLKSWYMAVRFDPRSAKFDGMDGAAEVESASIDAPVAEDAPVEAKEAASPTLVSHTTGKGKVLHGVIRKDLSLTEAKAIDKFTFKKDGGYFIRQEHLEALNAAHPLAAPAKPATESAAEPNPAGTLTNALLLKIESGNMPKDNPALRKMVEAFDGTPATPERMKQAQEALETAIVRAARIVVERTGGDQSTYDALVRLYASQPNLNIRTSTSIENQAYSTPAPLAFVASRLAGITNKTAVLEPTGGNGMLLIAASQSKAVVNELNDDRVASLEAQGFEVSQADATKPDLFAPKSVDSVITNPPFGPIKDAQGNSTKVKVDGYTLGQIDHLIAARALQAMKDDGSATLIIGANKVTGEQSNNDLIFFNWLYGNYNVTSHFEVDGDLYQRQGAAWPVRVITIVGRNRSSTTAPATGTIQRATTWSEVYEQFQQGMGAQRDTGQSGTGTIGTQPRQGDNDTGPVSVPAGNKAQQSDSGRSSGGASGNGNVAGASTGTVLNRPTKPGSGVGDGNSARGNTNATTGPGIGAGGNDAGTTSVTAPNSRTPVVTDASNQFQAKYVPRSSRKDDGVLIPVNMAGPTQDALNRLEDEVGDIDEFARTELGYKSVKELHDAFMGLQVDSVASAINQIKKDKGVIIADQTGIGKGRQAAAIIRWAAKNGKTPVFVTVKPSLFTDMYGDLHDIGTDDIAPFILNKDESIKGKGDEKLFANRGNVHTAVMTKIANTGELPKGSNALFMTYSQINKDNIQRKAVLSIAPNAVFVLDESHNAGGDSGTGAFIRDALGLSGGVTYLSATYAKRPDNMPVYFKTDIGEAVADDATLMNAMASGGLPLQTVVANNLVKAGQMFRRERSYDGVNIESRADSAHRAEHVKMSDTTTLALRAIVHADSTFHNNYVKSLQKELKKEGSKVLDMAGNQAEASVDHTQFSSVVHNFVRQMLLGLKAQEAADDAIRSLKRGEKPLIAVENTMGSFLNEYAENNGLSVGDELGAFTYKTVLSRALERSRYIVRQLPNGDKVKEYIPMGKLDPVSYEAYASAQEVIDGLQIDIPVSPIDWMRNEITKAGYTVAEVTGRNLSVDYSDPKNPKLSQIDVREQKDKVRTTRLFNSGKLDALVLNVAGSTGISLHSSEKFTDQRQRHMIVAQAAQDINIFMQMLGRIHRTGQVNLPKYTLLSADLPAEIRPTALLSGKMKSLNANTSSNTESATSVKSSDMLNKYGDRVVGQYLIDNPALADALGLDAPSENGDGSEDIARKATGRLALMPVKVQEQFYAEVEEQYSTLIDYLNKTSQNELEPKTFDFDAKETKSEVLFAGQNKASPFGEDAFYGEYSVKAQGKAMTPEEIKAAMADHLEGQTAAQHSAALKDRLSTAYKLYVNSLHDALKDSARLAASKGTLFLRDHPIGSIFRVDINGDNYNAIVTNIRSTHKANGNPFSMSKFQVTIAVNGALRSVTVPASQFSHIEVSAVHGYAQSAIDQLFKVGPPNEREVAKIVTGNLLGAYGEMEGTRGSIITFTKADGSTEQGILLPKAFNFAKDVRQDYLLRTPADVYKFVTQSQNENIGKFGINSRDNTVRVSPSGNDSITIQVPKSKAKGGKFFLDKKLLATTGDFTSQGNYMRATVEGKSSSLAALEVLMQKQALYALPSMAEEARTILGDTGPAAAFSRATRPVNRKGQPAHAVQTMVDMIATRWTNAPKIVVVQNLEDSRVPEGVRKEGQALESKVKSQKSTDKAGAPDGFYVEHDSGTVYLIADKLSGDADVVRVLMHESLGHHGLRGHYGEELGTILDRMAVLNVDKVRNAAKHLGLDFNDTEQRRMAAEEVLAYMAQNMPELGWVRKSVAVVRSWMRRNIPGFGKMAMSDSELIHNYILPARNWVENGSPDGSGGGKKGGNVATKTPFSRDLGEALTSGLNNVRAVKLAAGYQVGDLFEGEGRLHWWHKSVGTMYHLAQKSEPFRKVYDSIQNFLNDVSYYAAESADLAPNILPKLDNISDIWKSPLSADDTKALSAPVFEGTLAWGRNKHGVAMRSDDIESELGATSLDDKAHMLVRAGHIDPKILRMWQGLPMEQYESIIEGKFEKEFMKPGVVFTPAELKEHFGMSDAQVSLYQEFRKATDKSIDNLAVSEMLNYAGKDSDPIREQVLETRSVEEAGQTLRDYLVSLVSMEPNRDSELSATAAKMLDISAHATDMKDRGYAPLSRFGTYTLEATLPTGERYFSLFETDRERNKMARILMDEKATDLKTGTMSQESYKLLNGISPETAALFGEMLGLDSQGSEAKDLAFQEYIKRGTANRSAMKRLLKRKGIAGFSEDSGRVLAGFIYSNSRKTASNLHNKETSSAVSDIPKEQGELKDAAVKLQEYVSNPQEEMQAFRGILFAQYLGGSVASAMVNATQPFAVTMPYLSQFGGIRKAAAQMARAVADATKDKTGDARLDAALKKAEEEGIVSPQEVHALQAQAMGKAHLQSGDGTRMGNALATGGNALSKLSLAWGKVFGIAEQFNRRTTFIAAYRTAIEHGIAEPAKFAEKAISETQFTYNKGNKPRWARGAIGSVLFTFKQYSVNYLELVTRMATAGEPGSPERLAGQKAAVLAIAILFLMAGADGLPFIEDIEDVLDGAMQRLGYNFSSKQQMKAFLTMQLGKDGANFVSNGLSGIPGMPIDVSGRLGMGNLIPATGLFIKKSDHTRDLMELAGPGGDMVKRGFKATEQALSGNVASALDTASPTAARNVVKAIDMVSSGMYRDDKGRKVIESTPAEAILKGIGFQPRNVKEVQDSSMAVQRMKDQYTIAASEIRQKMALAIFSGDDAAKQRARDALTAWNENNPDQHMTLNMPAVLSRVREMRKSKEQRMADTAPKGIRAQVRAKLQEDKS